jgi:rod shape-determining protein MreD
VAEVKRAILSVAVLGVALMLQLTVVNRLPLPGAGAPDLVLLAVVALSLCGGPASGAITGFGAGLALDIAPPGSYLIGEYALVFCLVGYLCGWVRGAVSRSALLTIGAAMAAAAVGEALSVGIGLAVSDPQVTWPAVREVLPSTLIYDVVLTPFVLYLVVRAVRLVDRLGRPAVAASQPADGSALLARTQAAGTLNGSAAAGATVLGGAGLLGGAGWLSGPGESSGARALRGGPRKGAAAHAPRTPRLRDAAARPGDGWIGSAPRTGLPASPRLRSGRPARLRPGSGTAGSAVARPSRPMPRPQATLKLGAAVRRRDGSVGRALGAAAAGSALGARPKSGPPGSAFRGRRPGAGRPAALAGAGTPSRRALSHGPRFRPDPRLRGGSARPDLRLSGSSPRTRPSRRVSLRLGSPRRHDGVLGGSVLGGRTRLGPGRGLAARPVNLRLGSGRRGGALGGTARRAARPVNLRLGSGRRGGALGGTARRAARPVNLRLGSRRRGRLPGGAPPLAGRPVKLRLGSGRSGPWARPRLGSSRRAWPRLRSGAAGGGRTALGRGNRLRTGRRVKFTTGGSSSFLATWTGGLLGGRSAVSRLGRRTGGLR